MGGMDMIGGSMGSLGGMGPLGSMDFLGCNMGMMGLGTMSGAMAANEAMFRAALQSTMTSQANSQLFLLLPVDLLQKALVPHGHLADIAQRCQIRIDLGVDVPPNMRQVSFTGSVPANAMAAYFLQERAVQYGGSGGCG